MTREEAIEILSFYQKGLNNWGLGRIAKAFDMAIEALKDRHKGEWIAHTTSVGDKEYIEYGRCSECGEMALVRMNFCPNCGADMRGDNNG